LTNLYYQDKKNYYLISASPRSS